MPVITRAGEVLITQQQQAGQPLIIDKMILANVMGLDSDVIPSRDQVMPAAEDIKIIKPITKDGLLNSNVVVYSTVFPSTDGTFDFNYMGLYSSAHDVIVAVAYVPQQTKIKTVGTDIGNVITKNFAIEFTAAADITGINISAESWQIDYTARLMSMDKNQRDMAKNIYGQSTFLNDAFKVKYAGDKYYLSAGKSILGGINYDLPADVEMVPGGLPQTVWIDAYQEASMVGLLSKFDVVFNDGTVIVDYIDGAVEHSLIRLGVINSSIDIIDGRGIVCSDLSLISSNVFNGVSEAVSFVTANPDRYKGGFTNSFYTKEECDELGISFPDGGCAAYIFGDDLGIHDSHSIFDAGRKQLKLNTNSLDVRQFGVNDGVIDNTERVLAAADYAYENKIRIVTVDKDVVINETNPSYLNNNRGNVIFVGNGKFSDVVTENSPLYRRQVIPVSAPSPNPKKDKNLDLSLKMNPDNGVIRVVFIGDSLSTSNANDLSTAGTKSVHFQQFIKECNPDCEFEFINRSIGGRRLIHINSTPSIPTIAAGYPWYTDPDRPWLDYVYDVNPHIVIIASGTNDASNLEPAHVTSVVDKIENNTSANIVFITNIGTVTSGLNDIVGSSHSTHSAKEGRDYAAGFYRSFANENGYPFIDLNRTFNMVVDGRDILATTVHASKTATLTNGFLTVDDSELCHEFSAEITVEAGAFTGAVSMAVSLSRVSTNQVLLISNSTGIVLKFKDGSGVNSIYKTVFTYIPVPVGEFKFECGVSGNEFFFKDISNGGRSGDVLTYPCRRFGGLFKPEIKYDQTVTGPVVSYDLNIGVPTPIMPQLTDYEFWGVVESGAYQDWAIGGNGINHPSSLGAAALYKSHYSQQVMRIKNDRTESEVYRYVRLNNDGTADICGRIVLTEGVTLVSLPFALINPERRANATCVSGGAYSVSVDSASSNNNSLALVGYDLATHNAAHGFPVVYNIIGAELV
ncbi:similar to tail fiber protein H [Oleispira antarctica RB-8]|uniref:Similar to tail fiber protein H n=1 Tax=Oleispira antarctica RB-8 TaxID=698738 RepID=R4YSG7_OLEAN|nr:similar to tail fiber protein H [Oleispira antarctica RB-8]